MKKSWAPVAAVAILAATTSAFSSGLTPATTESGVGTNGSNALLSQLEPLRQLSNLLATHAGRDAAPIDIPVQSPTLGRLLTPSQIVDELWMQAHGDPEPLRTALAAWSDTIDATENPYLLEAALAKADAWPRPVQVAVAVLVASLTEATRLQAGALDDLTAADVTRLIEEIPELARASVSAYQMPEAAELIALVQRIQPGLLLAASAVLVAAIDRSLPALQSWSDEVYAGEPQARRLREAIANLAVAETEGTDHAMKRVIGAVFESGRILGVDAPAVAPDARPANPSDAVASLTATLGLGAADAATEHAALASLPRELKSALARIVAAYDHVAQGEDLPTNQQLARLAALLETVRAAHPSLEKWGLVYEHHYLGLPKTGIASLDEFQAFARLATRADASPQEIVRWVAFHQGHVNLGPAPVLPAASLADETLRMYRQHGVAPTPDEEARMRRGADFLAPPVAQAAGSMLWALNEAEAAIATLQEETQERHRDFLESDGVDRAHKILASDATTPQDLPTVREYFALVAESQRVVTSQALTISAAGEQARGLLSPPFEPHAAATVHPAAPWSRVVDGLVSLVRYTSILGLLPTATAQAPTGCPAASPASACHNDIWFQDPLLKWVIIGGPGTTRYDPLLIKGGLGLPNGVTLDTRGQMLTLDLGGADIYRNNAGGVRPAIGSFAASLALDLGGDDEYETPPTGTDTTGTQGAGILGVGLLWDVAGNDAYEAATRSQGFGGGTTFLGVPMAGFGLLLDDAGDDEYVATSHAQGMGHGQTPGGLPGTGLLVDRGGNDQYRILQPNAPGLGAALGGHGFLVDTQGNDRYAGGFQGNVPTVTTSFPGTTPSFGVGALVDLGGSDSYTRLRPPTTQAMKNGDCWTSLRSPTKDPGAGIRVSGPPSDFANDAQSAANSLLGLFVDASPEEACRYDPSPLKPPLLSVLPPLPRAPDAAELTADDVDGDRWPRAIEVLAGTDPSDPSSHPAGWPRRPETWPDALPYPPVGAPGPPDGAAIIFLPGLLVLGDADAGLYPKGSDHAITIDLGGQDTYRNRIGGGHAFLEGLPSLALDIGDDDDQYEAPEFSLGANGILVDFGGDDRYRAPANAMGYANQTKPLRLSVGLLADLGGNDDYRLDGFGLALLNTTRGPSFVAAQHAALALLVDVDGNDRYEAETQALARGGSNVPAAGVALFADLAGNDTYRSRRPRASIEHVTEAPELAPYTQSLFALFLDADGWDHSFLQGRGGALIDRTAKDNNRYSAETQNRRGALAQNPPAVNYVGAYADLNRTAGGSVNDQCEATPGSGTPITCPGEDPFFLQLPTLGIAITNGVFPNVHDEDAFLILDVGGDDRYLNNAGGSRFRLVGSPTQTTPPDATTRRTEGELRPIAVASMVLDLGGDDVYDASARPGRGRQAPLRPEDLGTDAGRLLGNDRLGVVAQGSGFLGVGLLMDTRGNDRYAARAFAQGAGLAGVGILWDRDGQDRYGFDPMVLGAPTIEAGATDWEALVADRWSVKSLSREGTSRRPDRAGTVLVYQTEESGQWDIRLGAAGTLVAAGPGNQQNARTDGTRIAWQDDETTDRSSDVWVRSAALDALPRLLTPDTPGTDQIVPDVSGPIVVWQDNRNGTWDVRAFHLLDGREFVVADDPSAEEESPRILGAHVVWAERGTGPGTTLRARNLVHGTVTTIASGIDLAAAPVLGPDYVLYAERTDAGDLLRRFDLSRSTSSTLAAGSLAPCSLAHRIRILGLDADASHAGRAAVLLLQETGTPDPKPLPQIWTLTYGTTPATFEQVGCLPQADPNLDLVPFLSPVPEDLSSRPGSAIAFLQGAFWQLGRGILLEEGGSDAYAGFGYAQGAGRSVTKLQGSSRNQPDQLGLGALLDLDGSDAYAANRFVQGAHDMVSQYPGSRATPGGTRFDAELESSVGVLLDVQGSDEYRATDYAQGWSGLTLGQVVVDVPADIMAIMPTNVPTPQTFADASGGLLLDLGGTDAYATTGAPKVLLRHTSFGPDGTTNTIVNHDIAGVSAITLPPPPVQACPAALLPPGLCPLYEAGRGQTAQHTVGRNNAVWSWSGVPGRSSASTNAPAPLPPTLNEGECVSLQPVQIPPNVPPGQVVTGPGLCPPVLVVGGIGADRDVMGPVQAGVAALLPAFFALSLDSPTQRPQGHLDDIALLRAVLRREPGPSSQVDSLGVKHVDFFVGPATGATPPRRLGPAFPCQAGASAPLQFCLSWDTRDGTAPDDTYIIHAEARFGHEATGVPMGSVQAQRNYVVNNPPGLRWESATGEHFSPHPFPHASEPVRPSRLVAFLRSTPDLAHQPGTARFEILDQLTGETVEEIDPAPPQDRGTHFRWTVEWPGTRGSDLALDATYRLRASIEDGAGHTAVAERPVRLDASAPALTCIRLANDPACNPGTPANPAGINTLNAARETIDENLRLVATLDLDQWEPDDSGIQRHFVFSRPFVGSTVGPWTAATVNGDNYPIAVNHGERVQIVVLAEDLVGNLECAAVCGRSNQAPSRSLESARDAKIDGLFLDGQHVGGAAVLRADAVEPRLLAATLNDAEPSVDVVPHLGPASRLYVNATGHEADTAPLRGLLALTSAEDPLTAVVEILIPPRPLATANTFRFEWEAWASTVALWPEGPVTYQLLLQDGAGNPSSVVRGQLLLDRTPPRVVPDSLRIDYPPGQRHASPGDFITLRAAIEDPPIGSFALPPDQLHAFVDASAITNAPVLVEADCAPGLHPASSVPLCFDGAEFFQVRLPIGSLPDFVDAASQFRELTLHVDDGLGNAAPIFEPVLIVVGEPRLGIADVAIEATFDAAEIRWTTARSAQSAARFAAAGQPLGDPLPADTDATGTRHSLFLEGLEALTDHELQIIAVDPATLVEEASTSFSFRTTSGLATAFLQPAPGSAISGDATVGWQTATAPGLDDPIRYELALETPEGAVPPRPLNLFEGPPGHHEFSLLTRTLPDGAYELRLRTLLSSDEEDLRSGLFLIDNTRPTASALTPPSNAVTTTLGVVVAAALNDATSGIDCARTTLALNDETLSEAECHDDRVRAAVDGLVAEGENRIRLRIFDRAGNGRDASWNFLADSRPPRELAATLTYPMSQSAAKPGDLIEVRLGATSIIGVRRAWLLAPGLGLPETVGLRPIDANFTGVFTVPLTAKAGNHTLTVFAEDKLGRTATTPSQIRVDDALPFVDRWIASVTPKGGLTIAFSSNEPVDLALEVRAPGRPVFRANATAAELRDPERGRARGTPDAIVQLLESALLSGAYTATGFTPGATLEVEAAIRDAAGHEVRHATTARPAEPGAPEPPSNLRAAIQEDGAAVLTWDAAPLLAPGTLYHVYRSVPGEPFRLAATTSALEWADPRTPAYGTVRFYATTQTPSGVESLPTPPVETTKASRPTVTLEPVRPSVGTTATRFVFRATYAAPDGRAPDAAWLVIDDQSVPLHPTTASPCDAGCGFEHVGLLPAPQMGQPEISFHVEFERGDERFRGPAEGHAAGPVVVDERPGLVAPDGYASGPGALLLALALWIGRRRA